MKDPDTIYQLRKEQEAEADYDHQERVSRKLDLTQRQVRALCEGAKKAGYAPVIQAGNMLVHLVPQEQALNLPEPGKKAKVDDDFKL